MKSFFMIITTAALMNLSASEVAQPCSVYPKGQTTESFQCVTAPRSDHPCFGKIGTDAECVMISRDIAIDREMAFYSDTSWHYVIRTLPQADDPYGECGLYGERFEDGWCYAAD